MILGSAHVFFICVPHRSFVLLLPITTVAEYRKESFRNLTVAARPDETRLVLGDSRGNTDRRWCLSEIKEDKIRCIRSGEEEKRSPKIIGDNFLGRWPRGSCHTGAKLCPLNFHAAQLGLPHCTLCALPLTTLPLHARLAPPSVYGNLS